MLFLLFSFLLSPVKAETISVPIYLFELKPLVYLDENKKIQGAWYKSFEKLAKKSDLKFEYQFMSIPRMELFLSGLRPGCNLTLFKSKKRQETINFIYDHHIKSVIKAYQRADDNRKWDLKKLKENKNVKIVANSSVGVDALAENDIKAELLFNINSIVHMLMIKRIDIYAGSNLAVETMDEFKSGKIKAGITIKKLLHGIGCSRGTQETITDRLKKGAKGWELEDS